MMNTKTISFLKSLSDEVWNIDVTAIHILKNLSQLNPVAMSLSSHGAVTHLTPYLIELVEIEKSLYLPELGISIENHYETDICLSLGRSNTKQIVIEITSKKLPESLCLFLEPTAKNINFIEQLTCLVKKITPIQDYKTITEKYSPSCPCCVSKQLAIKKHPDQHPLYRVLHKIKIGNAIRFTHSGDTIHSYQEVKIDNIKCKCGIVSLNGESKGISIDLTQVYSIQVQIEFVKGISFSTITGFNSHGVLIFKLFREGVNAFHHWIGEL